MGAVFALPVRLSAQPVGALDLFRTARGPLTETGLAGGLVAAELAAVPLLDLLAGLTLAQAAGETGDGWLQLASLDRVEVYQATGMLMGAWNIDATEALIRLRARAFTLGVTAGELAWQIVERDVLLTSPDWHDLGDPGSTQ